MALGVERDPFHIDSYRHDASNDHLEKTVRTSIRSDDQGFTCTRGVEVVPECSAALSRFQMTSTRGKNSGTALFHITHLETPVRCLPTVDDCRELT